MIKNNCAVRARRVAGGEGGAAGYFEFPKLINLERVERRQSVILTSLDNGAGWLPTGYFV